MACSLPPSETACSPRGATADRISRGGAAAGVGLPSGDSLGFEFMLHYIVGRSQTSPNFKGSYRIHHFGWVCSWHRGLGA